MITMLSVKVTFEITKEAKDSFFVTCPQIGCIFVHEETEEAAIKAAQDAVEAYVGMSLKHDDPIPQEIVQRREEIPEIPRVSRLSRRTPPPVTLEVANDIAVAF